MKSDLVYLHMTRLAFRNVRLNWRHSLATLVAITAGFVAIATFRGFLADTKLNGVNGFSKRYMLGDTIVTTEGAKLDQNADMWKQSLAKEQQDFLDDFYSHDPEFLRRVRFLSVYGMAIAGKRSAIYVGTGYDLAEGAAMRGEHYEKNAISGSILTPDKPGIVVGVALGQLLGCTGGYKSRLLARINLALDPANVEPLKCADSRVTLTASTEGANVNTIDLPIVGLIDGTYREVDRMLMNISLTDAQKLLNTDKVSFEGVALKHPSEQAAFSARLEAAAKAKGFHLQSRTWRDFGLGSQLSAQLMLLDLLSAIFGSMVIGICVMSIANTMMKSVTERIREIGTLRSLGFLRSHIVYMFALEGAFISLLGCGIGLALTIVVGEAIGAFEIGYTAGMSATPLAVRVGFVPGVWIICTVAMSLLATVTALVSARRAARMVIADAMRHV